MAKTNGKLGLYITVGVLLVSMGMAWATVGQIVKGHTGQIDELKAGKADRELIETRLGHLHEEIGELKVGQQAIMKKLDEIKEPG